MLCFKRVKIRSHEVGLYFHDGEFRRLLTPGRHWLFDPLWKVRVDTMSQRTPWIAHEQLDVIVKSGQSVGHAEIVDLKDHERALVWIEGRFSHILPPGLHAYWTEFKDVQVQVVDARKVQFEHPDFATIVRSPMASQVLDVCEVQRHHVGVVFVNGDYTATLPPGQYAWWRHLATTKLVEVDMREQSFDVAGQEIMTADKVTLRMNASVNYRVVDAPKVGMVTEGAKQSLYREAQLALRAVVGTRDLDSFLTGKDVVADEFREQLHRRASELGLEIVSVGVRDLILPGDMKELMNKVMEAKKAAEANLIGRREETAAMRSQANTARLLADNPTLMRLRELEVLEKVASAGQLNVVLGDKGLADRVVNLL
ncbi:slipin family protein [Aeoliella mucimassa]|uniref:FtsH protease regulator HflK n=1 Tax=Aeoliella mucimassa TaxID=2527972 RepID=A0A518AMF1_9BACT|nr:slipin family protein [Aeoliella mucimassa]QDU55900.1 FtsH protease regulator HflK [Aeoliella mucimassa]